MKERGLRCGLTINREVSIRDIGIFLVKEPLLPLPSRGIRDVLSVVVPGGGSVVKVLVVGTKFGVTDSK